MGKEKFLKKFLQHLAINVDSTIIVYYHVLLDMHTNY